MDIFLTGIAASLSAAIMFLVFLRLLRPKIEISSTIGVIENSENNKYVIKIINRSRRDAVDLKAELSRVRIKMVPDGQIQSVKKIELKKECIFSLSKYNESDEEANYAYRFCTEENIHNLWADDSTYYLKLKIYAKDETSGYGKIFIKEFRLKRNSLITGEFRYGNSLEIA